MLNIARTHDYQLHLSPSPEYPAAVNPPSFNWPENIGLENIDSENIDSEKKKPQQYKLELKNTTNDQEWDWDKVNSPIQLSFQLPLGKYQWRLITNSNGHSKQVTDQVSEWIHFEITQAQENYIAPTAKELFEQCDGHEQWLMYFNEDIESIKQQSHDIYPKLKHTATLSVPMSEITYPQHYQRGQEEGKREAIANVRNWIDRDLMVHVLLYRIWGEKEHGHEARDRLLQLAQWSPEGPASLLRPCTWGDEVGCSLARNLFIAYHWLSPLLNVNEKNLLVRPMLVRIARQITERLKQDNFKQYPGHSHTSRLPAYLGLAALALYREHDRDECEQWLTESLMIYRGILPFYGGIDGSWVEGPFYASTYSKWFHPFFLSVERLSGFSFYQHPFYQNFLNFARDFITPEQDIHPFGDGFWCRRDGKEWPGFFSQNPLRIYATRFGDAADYQQSLALEKSIIDYRLHLLDIVPTVKQIAFDTSAKNKPQNEDKLTQLSTLNNYYIHSGLGKLTQQQLSLYYRSSVFGNSSHRHGDQGNIALFNQGVGLIIPTGSYGYRFGSKHHSQWTRETIAHNLPLVGGKGQKLDDQNAVAKIIDSQTESNYHMVTLDLSETYDNPVEHFYRTFVLVEDYGLIILDSISLNKSKALNWRLHSQLEAKLSKENNTLLIDPSKKIEPYKCQLLSHSMIQSTLTHGYEDELDIPERAIESDASTEVVHLDWQLPEDTEHQVIACCIKESMSFPEIRNTKKTDSEHIFIELKVQQQFLTIPIVK